MCSMGLDINKNVDAIYKYFNIESIMDYLKNHILSGVIAILIIVFFRRIRNLILTIIKKFLKKMLAANPGVRTFITSIIGLCIDLFLLFIILKLLGINLSGIFALFSVIGLVLGFAFKESLSNVFGGIIILTFKPFKVNDVIQYNSFIGTVRKIEIYYTTIVNFQNENVIVPNGNLATTEIRNINSNSHRRLDMQVGVGYGSNIAQVKALILDIINRRKDDLFYLDQTPPMIGMYEIAASTLNFDIRVFVRENQYLMARYYLNETIKTEFDANNIDLPYNIVDTRITSYVEKEVQK